MRPTTRGTLAAALTALLVAGCSITPSITQRLPDRDPDQLLSQAEQQGARQAAVTRLEAADILARQDRRQQALEVARDLDDSELSDAERLRWAMLLSELGESEGDPGSVIRAGQLLSTTSPPSEQANLLMERLGRALASNGMSLEASAAYLRLQQATNREDLNDVIWEQLIALSPAELERLGSGGDELTQSWIELVTLFRSSGGSIDQLLARIEDWRGSRSNHPAARQLPAGILALRNLDISTVSHIAVFLPESGPLANIADALEKGLRAHQRQVTTEGTQLSFHDSSSTSLDELYQQANANNAQVVIGPLSKDKVSELEKRDSVPIPTLALNYGKGDRNLAKGLYQFGLSAEDEARQVAERGRADGHSSASLLIPNNGWGQRVGESFTSTWRQSGGEVTRVVDYNPKQPATESTRRAAASPQPDMLFLLALPDYARQVPPTLDYYNANDLPVYATSHLHEGRGQTRLDKDLNGIMFVDIPWQIPEAAAGGADLVPFSDLYYQLYKDADPALIRLIAMGVDAYELGVRLPYLQAIPGSQLQGATGTLRADHDRRIHRQLPWAHFENGVPRPLINTSAFDDSLGGNQLDDAQGR